MLLMCAQLRLQIHSDLLLTPELTLFFGELTCFYSEDSSFLILEFVPILVLHKQLIKPVM